METIRSGTTTERIVRTAILTAVLVLYSAWSFWDGYYAWPLNKNLPNMLQNLAVPRPPDWELINPLVTRKAFASIETGDSPDKLEALLGAGISRGYAASSTGHKDRCPHGACRLEVNEGGGNIYHLCE